MGLCVHSIIATADDFDLGLSVCRAHLIHLMGTAVTGVVAKQTKAGVERAHNSGAVTMKLSSALQ